jgi:HAD superfamily hydrolase (TIGR01450 family)
MARTDFHDVDGAAAPRLVSAAVDVSPRPQRLDGRALLIDWDGAVAVSNRFHAGALEFLQRHASRVAIVSNNSTELPEDFSQALSRQGVFIPPERILLAGAEAIRIAASRSPSRVMLLGSRKMMAHAIRSGLSVTRSDPEVVVLLRDIQINYRRLERAANGLRDGAGLIVANPDLTHPVADGRITPETGALLAALLACVPGVSVKQETVGKPEPHLYLRALDALGARAGDAVMIGDNPDTDIAGARALGIEAILVDAVRGIGVLN